MKEKGKKWEWDHGNKVILADRNMCRDRNMFLVPKKSEVEERKIINTNLHTGETRQVVAWRWNNDERTFLVPIELFQAAKLGGITRDIISYCGQLFREQHYPEDLKIKAFARQIIEGIGMAWAGSRTAQEVDDCLAFARFFTIQNHPLVTKLSASGALKETQKATFGFIDMAGRIDIYNCQKVPRNKQWYQIYLSRIYGAALTTIPPAPVPVAALEAAHRVAWRLQVPTKNVAYHLAARVPTKEIRLLVTTLREIACFKDRADGRTDKTRKSIENVLEILHPVMVDNYNFKNEGYDIILAGKYEKK